MLLNIKSRSTCPISAATKMKMDNDGLKLFVEGFEVDEDIMLRSDLVRGKVLTLCKEWKEDRPMEKGRTKQVQPWK